MRYASTVWGVNLAAVQRTSMFVVRLMVCEDHVHS